MANIDVISLIFESFELIKARYKEVAVPIMVLLIIAGAGHFGGSSLSDALGSQRSGSLGHYDSSPLSNAMSGSDALLAGLTGGVLLVVLAFVVAMAFAMAVLSMAIWFYMSEHFNAVLIKKKIAQDWQARMKRHIIKAFVMALFEFALIGSAILAGVGIALSYSTIGLIGAVVLFALLAIAFVCLGFFIIPAWMYYAIDNLPFFESISRSFSLVSGNITHFLVFAIIFAMLGIGSGLASIYACCFSFILAPILTVFFALLSRVTLLKMKLGIEQQERKN